MDVLTFALQMEKDGEAFYRQLAHRTANKGLTTILTMLADEEVKHQQAIEMMKTEVPKLEESHVLTRAKSIFTEIKESGKVLPDDTSQVELYQKAQEIEIRSRDFYLEKAAELDDQDQAALFKALAAEEEKHNRLLENIIDFVSEPDTWLEDAEFVHLDEEY
jgi:rubrerythrin